MRKILSLFLALVMVLTNYIRSFECGVVSAGNFPLPESYPNMLVDYSTVYGSGRIVIAVE